MAFANLKVILLNGIWKPLVFNINAQGFIPLALPRQKQSAFADTRINNQSDLFNVRAYDREQKFATVVRGTVDRLFFVLVKVVCIDPLPNLPLFFRQILGSQIGTTYRRANPF